MLTPDDLAALRSAYDSGGWMLAASVAVTMLVAIYRRAPVQALLGGVSPWLLWDSWPRWVRMLIVAASTVGAALLAAPSQHVTIGAALLGAVPALLGALGMHELGASGVKALAELRPPTRRPLDPTARDLSLRTRPPGT